MKRIAFIHNNFPAGGAERVTIDIASYLESLDGYEVYVYASRIAEPLLTDAISDSITLRKIPTQAVPARRARQIEQYVVEDRIDVLVQVTKAIPGIDDIKARTGVRTVVACHGEPFWQRYAIVYRRQKGVVRKLMWNLYNRKRYEDGTLARRKAVARTLREYNGCDAYTVLCKPYKYETASELGIDPEDSHIYAIENTEYPLDEVNYDKEKMILFCGRFENWSKRIDRLMRIWAEVQDRMPEWKLVLVGNGEDFDRIRAMSEDLDLQRVTFEGRRSNVGDYYRKASVVVMTSDTEGWGLTLTEGQAHGCIPVAFDCTSGVKEVIGPDGECGFLVPSYDESLFAGTLLRIASMGKEEELRLRKNAVRRVARLAPENIAEKWRVLFDDLCRKKLNVADKVNRYESI